MSKLRHSWPHMSRRDRRLQHRHDLRCPPEEGSCACCCCDCDPAPRGGRPRFYGITGRHSLKCERQMRTTPRGRITTGPVPLPFAHRRRRW